MGVDVAGVSGYLEGLSTIGRVPPDKALDVLEVCAIWEIQIHISSRKLRPKLSRGLDPREAGQGGRLERVIGTPPCYQ